MNPAEYQLLERSMVEAGFDEPTAFALALLGEELGRMREDRSRIDTGPTFLHQAVESALHRNGLDPSTATVADVVKVRTGGRK